MKILSEQIYREEMQKTVEPYLNKLRQTADFKSFDGKPIHAVKYILEKPSGVVVISHGFTESQEKYHEMIYYFLKSGYNVWALDHRGHGNSFRKAADHTVSHVDVFSEYVRDFEVFVNENVKPQSGQLPLCLYAHSMGGAVGILYLEQHPDVFKAAILTAPMVAPKTHGVPVFLGKMICRVAIKLHKDADRVFFFKEFAVPEPYDKGASSSHARYEYYANMRAKNQHLQNNAPSYSWTLQSLCVKKQILKDNDPKKIKTPMILFSADMDDYVLESAQKAFCNLSGCEFIKVHGTKHEIYGAENPVVKPYLEKILSFYEAHCGRQGVHAR